MTARYPDAGMGVTPQVGTMEEYVDSAKVLAAMEDSGG